MSDAVTSLGITIHRLVEEAKRHQEKAEEAETKRRESQRQQVQDRREAEETAAANREASRKREARTQTHRLKFRPISYKGAFRVATVRYRRLL